MTPPSRWQIIQNFINNNGGIDEVKFTKIYNTADPYFKYEVNQYIDMYHYAKKEEEKEIYLVARYVAMLDDFRYLQWRQWHIKNKTGCEGGSFQIKSPEFIIDDQVFKWKFIESRKE